ncbi:major facilitator superfamily MFS_1 [Mycobacterium xenopi 3993]|nr:major facilitator superfamily MFS_1 [Mycobacterium xenopi 3993]
MRWPARCWRPGWWPGWVSGPRSTWRQFRPVRGPGDHRGRSRSPPPAGAATTTVRRRLELGALRDAGMLRALLPVALFEFGNVATTLLILRATQLLTSPHRSLTAATSLAILIYAGHNVIATVASLTAGRWYDRTGRAPSSRPARPCT